MASISFHRASMILGDAPPTHHDMSWRMSYRRWRVAPLGIMLIAIGDASFRADTLMMGDNIACYALSRQHRLSKRDISAIDISIKSRGMVLPSYDEYYQSAIWPRHRCYRPYFNYFERDMYFCWYRYFRPLLRAAKKALLTSSAWGRAIKGT